VFSVSSNSSLLTLLTASQEIKNATVKNNNDIFAR